MKSMMVFAVALGLTLSSFKANTFEGTANYSEQMGSNVVAALQRSSSQAFAALFPSLSDFHQVMQENSLLYGDYLEDAKQEFANRYERKLLPELKESFDGILADGKKKGIDWGKIQFVGVDAGQAGTNNLATYPVTVTFTSQGQEHKLFIEKAFVLHGQWKISKFVSLQ